MSRANLPVLGRLVLLGLGLGGLLAVHQVYSRQASALPVAGSIGRPAPVPSGVPSLVKGPAPELPPPVVSATCKTAPGGTLAHHTTQGDPAARAGAQHGLDFVARNAMDWQGQHQCYGCHVQAVTLEALTVGLHNHYEVPKANVEAILHGMLDLPGGAHQTAGFTFQGGQLPEPAKAFGGAAFAHYDQFIDGRVRDELLGVAGQLIQFQQKDGHVGDYANGPVAVGPMQTTTQALQTWRQAYDRTADERWLAPMRRAESYLQASAKALTASSSAQTEQLDYAVIGLISAGASRSEATVTALVQELLGAQNEDGGWGLEKHTGSAALPTGATLYALRLTGRASQDAPLARGVRWLLAHQAEDGGWSHLGSARGEAMWAVLGLVTLDALTVDVAGLKDGEHVDGARELHATAVDNDGHTVSRIELSVDDVTLASTCGSALDFKLSGAWLNDGIHTVDVKAENDRGQSSLRRIQIYGGAYYLTELGTRFEDNGTTIALRDLASPDMAHRVELHVYSSPEGNSSAAHVAEVFQRTQPGAQGPMRFFWDGKDGTGKVQPHGTYIAEVVWKSPSGQALQRLETTFVNDTMEVQNAKYGEVMGQLNAPGKGAIANASVELVDDSGHVMQRVTSTSEGNYRFRSVTKGDYHVRVNRSGFDPADVPVTAQAAAAAPAPVQMKAQ